MTSEEKIIKTKVHLLRLKPTLANLAALYLVEACNASQ